MKVDFRDLGSCHRWRHGDQRAFVSIERIVVIWHVAADPAEVGEDRSFEGIVSIVCLEGDGGEVGLESVLVLVVTRGYLLRECIDFGKEVDGWWLVAGAWVLEVRERRVKEGPFSEVANHCGSNLLVEWDRGEASVGGLEQEMSAYGP